MILVCDVDSTICVAFLQIASNRAGNLFNQTPQDKLKRLCDTGCFVKIIRCVSFHFRTLILELVGVIKSL